MDKFMKIIEAVDKAAKTISHVLKAWDDVQEHVDGRRRKTSCRGRGKRRR